MPQHTTGKNNATKEDDSTSWDTPPPTSFSSGVKLTTETTTRKESELGQQQFNIDSTTIQHPQNVDSIKNAQSVHEVKDVEYQEVIQHTTKDEGERVGVEQVQSKSILQKPQQVNLPTTGSKTSSPTNPFNQTLTSQPEAFTNKYQPVEVLNSEGEWISGYFVHKCLVVANLEGIERKYALSDEMGAKYVFWGEIRLPRAKE